MLVSCSQPIIVYCYNKYYKFGKIQLQQLETSLQNAKIKYNFEDSFFSSDHTAPLWCSQAAHKFSVESETIQKF